MKKLLKQCAGTDIGKDDFHVRLLALTSTDHSEKSCGKRKFNNDPKGHHEYADWLEAKNPKGVKLTVVMEATGVYYEALAYTLHQRGFTVCVELPNKIKNFVRSFNENSKTDLIDAQAIARFGLQRNLRQWEPYSKMSRMLKLLGREYQQIEDKRTVSKNQLHAASYAQGGSQETIVRLTEMIALLDRQQKLVLDEMEGLLSEDDRLARAVDLLTSIHGVGNKTAFAIIGETDGLKLFTSRAQLIKYSGLDVVYKQSGTSVNGKTRISKKGNSRIRKALFFPSMSAKNNGIFKEVYDRQYERTKCKMSALVAVQRKLLITMYALIKNDAFYIENYHKMNMEDGGLKGADRHKGRPAVAAS